MFDILADMLTDYFAWQHNTALTIAEWLTHTIDKATRPPTPVYLPKVPMTAEEIERVRWRSEQHTD